MNDNYSTATVTVANVGDGNLAGSGTPYNLNGSITTLNGSGFVNGATPPDTVSLLNSNGAGGPTTGAYNYTFTPVVRGSSTTVVTATFSNGSSDGTNNAQTVGNTITRHGCGAGQQRGWRGDHRPRQRLRANRHANRHGGDHGANAGDGNLWVRHDQQPARLCRCHGAAAVRRCAGGDARRQLRPGRQQVASFSYTFAPTSTGYFFFFFFFFFFFKKKKKKSCLAEHILGSSINGHLQTQKLHARRAIGGDVMPATSLAFVKGAP